MRCLLLPDVDQRLSFSPVALTDQQMAQSIVKRASCGAVFLGRLEKIYALTSCQVIWDVQVKQEPPASLRASKPKLHFRAKTTLFKDFVYKLV